MRVLLLALFAGCACPETPCGALLQLDLTVSTWTAGAWSVRAGPDDDLWLDCQITVPTGDAPPTDLDITCAGRVERAAFLGDTGGTGDPYRLHLEAPRPGADVPATLRVLVARDGLTAHDATHPLAWTASTRGAATCRLACETATISVDVP